MIFDFVTVGTASATCRTKALLATAGKKLSISVVGVRKEFARIVHCGNLNSVFEAFNIGLTAINLYACRVLVVRRRLETKRALPCPDAATP